jgi:hypothetical protein
LGIVVTSDAIVRYRPFGDSGRAVSRILKGEHP